LSALLESYSAAALGTSPDSSPSAEISWRVDSAHSQLFDSHTESYMGDWALMAFTQIPQSPALPKRLDWKDCGELQEILVRAEADLLILSLPDDNEWLLIERIAL
jgi:hypothetical protein